MPELIRHIAPQNFLSFGPDNPGIDLLPLNLLIGPNGSGKSNLIESINFMRSAPKEFRDVTRKGGGIAEWIWKGSKDSPACLDWEVKLPQFKGTLRHIVQFSPNGQSFFLEAEAIESGKFRFSYQFGDSTAVYHANNVTRILESVEPDRSVLGQRRDPDGFPEFTAMAVKYEKIRIYREWSFGRNAVFREPQKADLRNDSLEEDFGNLGLFLNRVKTKFPVAKRAILKGLQDLYEGITDFDVFIEGGTVQVFFTEGDFSIPATRLSDGTLRYLCLLAILCDPEPPPLICIEEPELGLHPDILPGLADLLKTASKRTQLIVTTHSDILVDAMSDTPESVVVCSKQEGQTVMERLNAADLTEWLEKYRLGELWTRGQIGGTRW